MVSIIKRKGKRGITYRATVCVKGQRVTSSFDRKSEAAKWAEDVEAILRDGGYVGEAAPGDTIFDKALERYLVEVSSRKAKSTAKTDNSSASRLLESFSGMSLKEIMPVDVARYRDERLRRVSASTVRTELALLSHLYTIADQVWGYDIANPVSRIRRPTLPPGRIRFLKNNEITQLLSEFRFAKKKRTFIIMCCCNFIRE